MNLDLSTYGWNFSMQNITAKHSFCIIGCRRSVLVSDQEVNSITCSSLSIFWVRTPLKPTSHASHCIINGFGKLLLCRIGAKIRTSLIYKKDVSASLFHSIDCFLHLPFNRLLIGDINVEKCKIKRLYHEHMPT